MADQNSMGNFAGAFLSAYTAARQGRDAKKLQDEMVKAQTKLFELQMKNEAARTAGIQDRDRMMTGRQQSAQVPGLSAPMWQQAPGPNGQPDPLGEMQPAKPMSLLDMIADPQGQTALLRSGDIKMSDLMGGRGGANTKAQTYEWVQGIINDPNSTPEQIEMATRIAGGGQSEMGALADQLRVDRERGLLTDQNTAREKGVRDQAEEDRLLKLDKDVKAFQLKQNFSTAKEIVKLQQELEDTVLRPGMPGNGLTTDLASFAAAAKEAFGADSKEYRDVVAKRQRLDKLFADGVITGLDRYSTEGGSGVLSGSKIQLMNEASAKSTNEAWANNQKIAKDLETQLTLLDFEEIPFPDEARKEIEDLIEELRKPRTQGAQKPPMVDVPGAIDSITGMSEELAAEVAQIAKMGADELKAFGSAVDLKEAPPQILKALEDRWDKVMQGDK